MLIDTSGSLFDTINNVISAIATIVSLIGIAAYWIFSTAKNLRERGGMRGFYLSFITLILLQFPLWGFFLLPEYLVYTAQIREEALLSDMPLSAIRWFVLYAVFPLLIFFATRKFSGIKSTITISTHLTISLLGWIMGKWFGIIFISIPILTLFYFLLYYYAQIVFPASNPEDADERHNKFLALFWYVWGAQYPFWVAPARAARNLEKRIGGDYFKDFGAPGIVWTHPYQVVGRSSGIEFNKIDGPGIMFTTQYERPVAIVDLRTQLRPTELQGMTKDGVAVKAVLFTSFKICDGSWGNLDRDERHRIWRTSPILQNGMDIDCPNGSYPYSTARVQAALGITSIGTPTEDNQTPDIYWDQIAVERVKKEARLVLSGRTFNEIWRPIDNDNRHTSALDEMATQINKRAKPLLQEIGVQLMASRIVHFDFAEDSNIREQLREAWLSAWEQKIHAIQLDGITAAEKLRLQARTSARSVFLESITESLNKARTLNKDLPKQVVALNFIATLKGLLQEPNLENTEQQIAKLETLQGFVLRNSQGGE